MTRSYLLIEKKREQMSKIEEDADRLYVELMRFENRYRDFLSGKEQNRLDGGRSALAAVLERCPKRLHEKYVEMERRKANALELERQRRERDELTYLHFWPARRGAEAKEGE